MDIKIYGKDRKTEISSLDDWRKFASPAGKDRQWEDGFSAKEHAKYILKKKEENNLGNEIDSVSNCMIYAEAVTSFGKGFGKGKARNHDSLIILDDLVVGVEAKVEENIGKTWGELDKTTENKQKRYFGISEKIYGKGITPKNDISYQLMQSSFATIIEANKADKRNALLLIITYIAKDNQKTEKNKEVVKEYINSITKDGKIFVACADEYKIKKFDIKHIEIDVRNNK